MPQARRNLLFGALPAVLLLLAAGASAQCHDYATTLHAVADLPLAEAPRVFEQEGDILHILADRTPWDPTVLYLVDVADPLTPLLVDTLDGPAYVAGFDVDQGYAYFATAQDGLQVIDLADTNRTGGLHLPWSGTAVRVAGSRAYVGHATSDTTQLLVVDVSVPLAPVLLGTLSLPPHLLGDIQDIEVSGGLAYLAMAADGVQIVDVTDPARPVHLGGTPTASAAVDLELRGPHALIADNSQGLTVVDVSDPLLPTVVANLPLRGWAKNLCLAGDVAYLATVDRGGLQTVDIGNPLAPVHVGSLPAVDGNAWDVCVAGGHAFFLEPAAGLRVADADPPDSPTGGMFDPMGDGSANDVLVRNGLAYVVTYVYGTLMIFDLADPDAPVELGSVMVGNEGFMVALDGDLACVSYLNWGGQSGIRIVDVSDPRFPVVVATHDPGGAIYAVTMDGGRAYVTTGSVVEIVDLSVAAAPVVLGAIPETGTPESSVAVAGDLAYVGNPDGFTVWDISIPAAPVLRGSESPALPVRALTLADDKIYADDEGRLRIIDVADPSDPVALGTVTLPQWCRDIEVYGSTAYAAVGYQGVQVLDVADPMAPVVIGAVALPQVTRAVSVEGSRIWLSADVIHWLPRQCGPVSGAGPIPASAPLDLRAWPNPFNPRTTLAFELPAAAPVQLAVFDVAGRLVRTLVAGETLGAGSHQRTWLGRDRSGRAVASGVYFLRLEAGEHRVVRRITLVR